MTRANVGPSRAIALLTAIAFVAFVATPATASQLPITSPERNWEVEVGQQAYTAYLHRGEIVPRESPLYGILDPIAKAIASVANRQYYVPFRFILLYEQEPNAFSMPGGNVYVTTGLLSYLANRDELAGVVCHEVNHDIHHDVYNLYQAEQRGAPAVAYERAAETRADRDGAYTCAKAGFNPWGMVWNLRLHRTMGQGWQMAASSDHPSDGQRLADLVALLTGDRTTFGRFRDDIAASTPLSGARAFAQSGYARTANRLPYPMQYPSQYPSQYPAQYPSQYPSQYPTQYPQQGYPEQGYPETEAQPAPYPPPPPPPCYPGC